MNTIFSAPRVMVGMLCALAAAASGGCGGSAPPEFHVDMAAIVAAQLEPGYDQDIANVLAALFGTPDEPFAPPATGLNLAKLELAAGPAHSYQPGLRGGLYRQHCAHCHGISGDGRGPTGLFLNPYPRDYRRGIYKFKSTYRSAKPTDDDLHRILSDGVPGTAMPSFALLAPGEIEALVEYVKYLSIRGEVEGELIRLINELDENEETENPDDYHRLDPVKYEYQRGLIDERLTFVSEQWESAANAVVIPEADHIPPDNRSPDEIEASVVRGRELFYGTKAACSTCHGPTGLGDGQTTDFNDWNKFVFEFGQSTERLPASISALRAELRGMDGASRESAETRLARMERELAERTRIQAVLFPPRNAFPRNLREAMYRGGRRPLDFFRRVHQGIPGTPMPAGGAASPGATGTLSEEEIWSIVDYVQSLPFEPASLPPHLPANMENIN